MSPITLSEWIWRTEWDNVEYVPPPLGNNDTLKGILRECDIRIIPCGNIDPIRYRQASLANHTSGIDLGTSLETRGG